MKEIVGASGVIAVPAARAWEVISGLNALDQWMPIVSSCRVEGSGVGARRYCTLANGAQLKERVDEVDQKQMRVRYSITESPLPLQGYVGTVIVTPAEGASAEITWYAEYTPTPEHSAQVREMLRAAIAEGIGGLETYCQKVTAQRGA